MVEVIAPADAFRLMLSAGYGKTTLKFAETIKSDAWFLFPSSAHVRVRTGKETKLAKIPRSVQTAADETREKLRKHVRDGDIRLRGELKPAEPPDYIDRADCLVGRLDVFAQTLTIYAHGFKPARIYRRVFCIKIDVDKIVENISKNKPGIAPREWPPTKGKAQPALKPAPDSKVRAEIGAVYDEADKDKNAPRPNINQLPGIVRPRLEARSLLASGRQIKKIGGEPQFKLRRRARGQKRS